MTTSRGNHEMKEMAEKYCANGIGAVETSSKLQEKYGVLAPTICTIYKWRREFRGGKGEREGNAEIDSLDGDQRPAKISKKGLDKYCAQCNREMCSRNYYELHMLRVHDILLGDTKPTMDYLDDMAPSKIQKLVFRCDACFGGALDYDTIQELQHHKFMEHGQTMRMPKWSPGAQKPKNKSPTLKFHQSTKSPLTSTISIHPSTLPRVTKIIIRRDKSLPASGILRRSTRVPKPSSAIIHSLLLAKDFEDETGEGNEHGETEKRKKELAKKGRRIVNFKEEIIEPKEEGNIVKEKKHKEINGDLNGVGQLPEEEEEETIVIKEDPLELEEQMGIHQQQQSTSTTLENGNRSNTQDKKRMMSPDALDAANSLLKLTFGSPLNALSDFLLEDGNSSTLDDNAETDVVSTAGRPMPIFDLLQSPPPKSTMSLAITSPPIQSPSAFTTIQSPRPSINIQSMEQSDDDSQTGSVPNGQAKSVPSKNQPMMGPKKLPNILKTGNLGKGVVKPTENKTQTNEKEDQIEKGKKDGEEKEKEVPQIEKEAAAGESISNANNFTSNETTQVAVNNQNAASAFEKEKSNVSIAPRSPSLVVTDTILNSSPPSASSILPSTIISGGATPPQTLMLLPQDDCTWFAHSIAAQLRLMPTQMKELAKMQMQQVIYECNTTTFSRLPTSAAIQQIVQKIQNNLPNGNGNGIAMNGGDGPSMGDDSQENIDVDVITVEENGRRTMDGGKVEGVGK